MTSALYQESKCRTRSTSVLSPLFRTVSPSIHSLLVQREGGAQVERTRRRERERERELEQGPGTEWWWSKHQWNFEPEKASLSLSPLSSLLYRLPFLSVSTILSLAISFAHHFFLSLTASFSLSRSLFTKKREKEQQTWRSWFSEGR